MLLIYNFESKQDCKSLAHIFLITLLRTCRHVMNPQNSTGRHLGSPLLTQGLHFSFAAGCPCTPLLLRWLPPREGQHTKAAAKAMIIPKHHHPASRMTLLYLVTDTRTSCVIKQKGLHSSAVPSESESSKFVSEKK